MATQTLTPPTRAPLALSSAPTARRLSTRTLLLGGVLAGPLYLIVGLLQALTRPGFDLTRPRVGVGGVHRTPSLA